MSGAMRCGRRGVSPHRNLEPTATLWYGCMSSGKSDRINIQMEVLRKAGYSCLLIKYDKDTRLTLTEGESISKSGVSYNHNTISVGKTGLMSMLDDPEDANHARLLAADCVGIDEVQFFGRVVEFVTLMVLREKKSVYMAGLDTNFLNEPWPYLAPMIAICTYSEKCLGVCKVCGSLNGSTSARISDDKSMEKIGGSEEYVTLCLACFVKNSKHTGKHLEVVTV
jgi:thymidine kinase